LAGKIATQKNKQNYKQMANWQIGNDIRADEFVQTKTPNLPKSKDRLWRRKERSNLISAIKKNRFYRCVEEQRKVRQHIFK
jgi:hypothetical protein